MTTESRALTADNLQGKTVLFRADESHGIRDMIGYVYDGSVISVDESRRIALVCFLFGYKSLTDEIKFDNLLAIADKAYGKQLEIGIYSGRFVDLRV